MPDLEGWFQQLRETAPPDLWETIEQRSDASSPRTARRWPLAVLAFIVAAAGGLGAFLAFKSGGTARPSSADARIAFVDHGVVSLVQPNGGTQALFHGSYPSWSPRGDRVAFWRFKNEKDFGDADLVVARGDGSEPQIVASQLGLPFTVGRPAWSPDGNRIAFAGFPEDRDRSGILVISADGSGHPTTLTSYEGRHVCYDLQPTWAPDGSSVAFVVDCETASQGLWTVHSDGTELHQIRRPANAEESLRFPAFSPDGQSILFQRETPPTAEIWTVRPDGSRPRFVAEGKYPAWSPDGNHLAFVAQEGITVTDASGRSLALVVSLQPDGCCLAWPPSTASGNHARAREDRLRALLGSDGERLLRQAPPSRIHLMNPDGTGAAPLTSSAGDRPLAYAPDWSREGRRLAFTIGEPASPPAVPRGTATSP